MAQAIAFPSQTANFELPLLFSGQVQKEFFLNQALATLDALLAGSIEETRAAPPTPAQEGLCFLVSPNADGDWLDHDDEIAVRVGDAWHFITPSEGMEVYDRTLGQKRVFKTQWELTSSPTPPQGGTVVDAEARAAISEILNSLRTLGILPETT